MRQGLGQQLKGADADVKSEPGNEQPARPAVTQEQEDSADHCQEPDEGNKDDPVFERSFCEVIDETY